MAGNKIYTCSGAVLKCSQGTANGSLVATPKSVSLCGRQQANIGDHVSMANIRPFGRCRSLAYPPTAAATSAHHGHLTPMPCVPGTPFNWSIIDANSKLCGKPALLNPAKLRCIYGGVISIVNPGQQLETTGTKSIEIKENAVKVSDYSWTSEDANQSRGLCLHTSLLEGAQLLVKLGKKVYPTVVGKQGVARVRNIDVSEVSMEIAGKPAEKATEKPADAPVKARPVDTGKVNTTTIPTPVNTGWGDPVSNPRIRRNSPSHLFGKVRRDAKGNPRNHQGFDYYAPTGTPVLSVGDGVIHTIQHGHSAYGLNITIRHTRGNGLVYSFYAHLNDLAGGIKVGKVVKKGEVIAHAGTSGNAKGFKGEDQHLHFECRTSPGHQLGLGGKENPNSIVATKFTASNLKGSKR